MERWCLVPWFWICFSWGVGYTESRQDWEWALSVSVFPVGKWKKSEEEWKKSEERDPQKFRKIRVVEVSWKKYLRRRAGSTVSNVKSWVEWGLRIDHWTWTIWSLLVSLTSSFTKVCTQNQTGEWARKGNGKAEPLPKVKITIFRKVFLFVFFGKEEEKKKWYLSWSGNGESRKDFFNG